MKINNFNRYFGEKGSTAHQVCPGSVLENWAQTGAVMLFSNRNTQFLGCFDPSNSTIYHENN